MRTITSWRHSVDKRLYVIEGDKGAHRYNTLDGVALSGDEGTIMRLRELERPLHQHVDAKSDGDLPATLTMPQVRRVLRDLGFIERLPRWR